ncbi:hypothetical protein [Escherichia sp. E4742]|uniref:hypothetical protein n=1 Tax=Escherichia sp. E4742 TaxID=2044467 RepID=UPI0010FF238D|nr:hypothetical protein [Escherichia sp. E4742]QCT88612.1 hypothetical protein FEM44_16220 [Escherichia sp. E4742]TLJ07842.1 hypothetical protein FEK62_16220 [Escherichia sp. E4742]
MSFISSLLLMTTLLSEFVGGVIAKDTGVNNMVEMAIARVDKLFLLISYHSLLSLKIKWRDAFYCTVFLPEAL